MSSELSHRATSCPAFAYRSSMETTAGIITHVSDDWTVITDDMGQVWWIPAGDEVANDVELLFTDGTNGCLLGLAREAHHAVDAHVTPYVYDEGVPTSYACWIVINENGKIVQSARGTGPSRAESIVCALESVPGSFLVAGQTVVSGDHA